MAAAIPKVEIREPQTGKEWSAAVMAGLNRIGGSDTAQRAIAITNSNMPGDNALSIAREELGSIRTYLQEIETICNRIAKAVHAGGIDESVLCEHGKDLSNVLTLLLEAAGTVKYAVRNRNLGLAGQDEILENVISLYTAAQPLDWTGFLGRMSGTAPGMREKVDKYISYYKKELYAALFGVAAAADGIETSAAALERMASLNDPNLDAAIIKNPAAPPELNERILAHALLRLDGCSAELLR